MRSRLTPFAILLFSLISGSSTLLFPLVTLESKAAEPTLDLSGVKRSAPKRLALVVGVDDYPESPLRLPVRDAELVSERLKSVGFEVMLIKNPTIGQLVDARDSFIRKINESGDNVTALFFFAGHAVQFDGHNYLIPTKSKLLGAAAGSANAPTEGAFKDQAMDAQLGILNYLGGSKASKIIFVLDACRENPFNPGRRASGRPAGLAKMNNTNPSDISILFAASPGQAALDGANDASNSPFTEAFAFAISQPGSSLEVVYRQVSDQVKKTTKGQQRPYQEGVPFIFMFRDPPPAPVVASGPARLIETGVERRQYDVARDGLQLLRQTLAKKSIEDIKKAAEGGDAEAQYLLGIAYNSGEGVTKDPERTAYWLRRSATRGFSRAQFALGQRLYGGWGGITPDKKEGFEWWLVAAENGNSSAMLAIGETYLYGREGVPGEDLAQAEKYYNQALSLGNLEAETNLGFLYATKATKAQKAGDTKGFEQASEKKLAYFQSAAQKGSSEGMYQLAYMYRYGDYVKVDVQQAIQWYGKSVAAGNFGAAETLAQLYLDESKTGIGKPQPEEAAKYFRIAMGLGSKSAGLELAELVKSGKVKPQTRDEVLKLYEQAVANSPLRAASNLSEIYLKGELVTKDLKKAEQYGLKALELEKTVKPDSEDAYPLYARLAAYTLLKLYKEEKLQPAKPQLVKDLEARVGPLNGGMKRFTVPITCGTVKSAFNVYVWDWKLDEPPSTAQFAWLEKARGCEVGKDIVEAFQKLYKIARDNNVSYSELTEYAVKNPNKKK